MARWGKKVGQRWRRSRSGSISGVGVGLDGSAKGAGGSGSSSSLPIGTLALLGAPPLLCGEFLGALGENLVQFLGRMTTASFGVATLPQKARLNKRPKLGTLARVERRKEIR
uniref:Uncharacterized protein n=1 Tax=Oryza rufipogon TaxID=4529 RepID=A0A0E0P321_ORYRU